MNTENLVMAEAGIGSTYNSFELTKEEEKKFEKECAYFQSRAEKYGIVATTWCLYQVRSLSLPSPFRGKFITDGIRDVKIPLPNRKLTGVDLWIAAEKLFLKIKDIEGVNEHSFIENFVQSSPDIVEVHFGS
jgi:hypothetical protein